MSENKTFIDTKLLIYAYDKTAAEKHEIANRIVKELWVSGLGVFKIS